MTSVGAVDFEEKFKLFPVWIKKEYCFRSLVMIAVEELSLILLLLLPFSTFFIQVDAPFETIRYCGFEWWNNCVQCWFPKWFWMVGQLIQNLVWIFPNGRSANTKPCLDTSTVSDKSMDPLKPFEWIWMVVQLATNTVQMISPCVYKTNGHFWEWKFWMVSNDLLVGWLMWFNTEAYT